MTLVRKPPVPPELNGIGRRLIQRFRPPRPVQRISFNNLCWHAEQAALARSVGDLRSMRESANKMERFGYYKEAWRTFHQISELENPGSGQPWRGPRQRVEGLFVQRRLRDLGDELRQVHLAARAVQEVPVVVVLTEERLVPLFERSFPAVRFISEISEIDPKLRMPVTSYEQLAYFYGRDEESIRNGFLPLTPPPSPQTERRGLGISWYSKAMYKNLPDLDDWAEVLRTVQGRIQSLQYRERAAGRRMLAQRSGRPIRTSRPVNQFLDLDGYAGQIASVRRVLTISNTTAHLAGALGIPCVVVLDDESVTTWPDHQERSPFYPNTRLIRRRGRDWQTTLREGLELLQSIEVKPGTMRPQTER